MEKPKIPTGITRGLEKKVEINLEKELETFATLVHGSLATLHGISLYYQLRKRKYIHATVHGAFLIYDLVATYRHFNARRQYD